MIADVFLNQKKPVPSAAQQPSTVEKIEGTDEQAPVPSAAQQLSTIPQSSADPQSDGIRAEKAELRRRMINRREQLAPEQARSWSGQMVKHLTTFLANMNQNEAEAGPAGCVMSPEFSDSAGSGQSGGRRYLAIYAAIRGEADLLPIIDIARRLGWTPCFPRIVQSADLASGRSHLIFVALPDGRSTDDFLAGGRFGLREPPLPTTAADICQPQVIILPGLAFDQNGNRLGWGKAYYDRYLQDPGLTQDRPVLIGAAYPFQVLPSVPVADHDQPVSWLLTPQGLQLVRPQLSEPVAQTDALR